MLIKDIIFIQMKAIQYAGLSSTEARELTRRLRDISRDLQQVLAALHEGTLLLDTTPEENDDNW